MKPSFLMRALLLAVGGFVAGSAYAESVTLKIPPRESYSGARAHGMGNAFVAVADDESAIFSNPAGIGQEDGRNSKNLLRGASFPNLSVAGNRNPTNVQRAYLKTEGDSSTKITNALNELSKFETMYGRVSVFPYFTVGRVQLGLLADQEMSVHRNDFETPQTSIYSTDAVPLTYNQNLNIYSRSQAGGVVGFSIPHFKLGLSFGVAARFMTRTTLLGEYEIGEGVTELSIEGLKNSINKSRGIGLDFGILVAPKKVKLNPAFGIAVRDFGNTQYKPSSGDVTEIEVMNIVAGGSIHPALGKYCGLLLSTEIERLNDARVEWSDKYKVGLELEIGTPESTAPLSLRAGWANRSVTYGATVDLLLVKLDVGKYAELIDTEAGMKIDGRYIARLSIDLRN